MYKNLDITHKNEGVANQRVSNTPNDLIVNQNFEKNINNNIDSSKINEIDNLLAQLNN